MNKKLVLGALSCLAAATAMAQNSVTVYGLIDAGVEHVTHANASGKSLTRLPKSTNTAPSRLGFRGVEDLGNGLKAVFTLEQGIVPANGTLGQGGRAFGRTAMVGLSGDFGTVSIGRLNTMTFYAGLDADILGPGIYGTGSLDSYLPNARADNALAWMKKFSSGLELGATYSFGRDTVNAGPSPAGTNCAGEQAGDSQACREWSVMAKYNAPTWGVAVSNDRIYGRTVTDASSPVFGGLNSSSKADNRLYLNGWVSLGQTRVGAGVIARKNDGAAILRDSQMWYLGASTPLSSALTLSGQFATLRYKDHGEANSTLLAVRLNYALSKRTAIYGQVGHIRNKDQAAVALSGGSPGSNPGLGMSQTGINLGVRTSF